MRGHLGGGLYGVCSTCTENMMVFFWFLGTLFQSISSIKKKKKCNFKTSTVIRGPWSVTLQTLSQSSTSLKIPTIKLDFTSHKLININSMIISHSDLFQHKLSLHLYHLISRSCCINCVINGAMILWLFCMWVFLILCDKA